MKKSSITVIVLLSAVLVAVVIGIVVFVNVSNNAAHDAELAKCDRYAIGSLDYYFCRNLAK